MFMRQMHAGHFPTFDTLSTWTTLDLVQGQHTQIIHYTEMNYTITPVPEGNVRTEPMDADEFARE
jgi:hypothetical protein